MILSGSMILSMMPYFSIFGSDITIKSIASKNSSTACKYSGWLPFLSVTVLNRSFKYSLLYNFFRLALNYICSAVFAASSVNVKKSIKIYQSAFLVKCNIPPFSPNDILRFFIIILYNESACLTSKFFGNFSYASVNDVKLGFPLLNQCGLFHGRKSQLRKPGNLFAQSFSECWPSSSSRYLMFFIPRTFRRLWNFLASER